jgi:type I restriction enzyme R subunit
LIRAWANIASEMEAAGYSRSSATAIQQEVTFYENLRCQIKLHSGDAIDLKQYEPAMRHLIDSYIRAGESEKVSAFDDLSLVELLVERGAEAVQALPAAIRKNKQAAAETIENNVRRLILDESPINPKYYEKMSELLDALIAQRKQDALDYQKYLQKIVELARQVKNGPDAGTYPKSLDSAAKRALFDNLDKDEALALTVDRAVRGNLQDGWRGNKMKTRKVWLAIRDILAGQDERIDKVVELAKKQNEY